MRVGITGASGHLGANLIPALAEAGHQIRVLQFNGDNGFANYPLEIVKGNILETASLGPFCQGLDVVFHLAALISIGDYPYKVLYETNVNGTKNIVNACREAKVKKLIHFSSIHALTHKPFDQPMDETRALALDSPIDYEKTKAIAEKWVLEQQSEDFDVVVLNPTAVLGPNDYAPSYLGQFIIRLLGNKLPGLLPGGYDWVDVRDIAQASVAAIQNARGGERYILAGEWKSVVEFTSLLARLSGKQLRKLVFPVWLARLGLPFLHLRAKILNRHPLYTNESLYILQAGNQHIKSDKARKDLGFKPRPLEETLQDCIRWYTEKKYL